MIKGKVAKQGQLRIIGGEWRSRRVSFTEVEGLRPTPDRVRETLFNWLAPYVEGAAVLDLFAGSGALFLEALSRGAIAATALDINPLVIKNLQEQLRILACQKADLVNQGAVQFLQGQPVRAYDLVFLDPPFRQSMLEESCQLLEANGWLADNAWVYTESEVAPSQLMMPVTWELSREKKAGQVYYALWHRYQ